MIAVNIGGTDRTASIEMGSLRITDNINHEVDTAEFSVLKYGALTYTPEAGQEVIITRDGTRIYYGIIIEIEHTLTGNDIIQYQVSCKDLSHFMDRLLVLERYEDTNLQAVVQDLIVRYGADQGFTSTNVGGASVSIKSITFNDIPLSACFNKLAQLTGYMWYVDYFKDVHFFEKNDEMAPYNLGDFSANYIYTSLALGDDISQLRNRVKVTGGEAEAEERTELLTGDGEKDIFPLGSKFAELPVIEVDGVPQTVGVEYLQKDEDYDVMWSYQEKYIRFTAGNIPPAPTGAATNITVTGIPLRPVIVQRSNNASISQYGVYEHHIINDQLRSREAALQFALADLTSYAQKIRSGSFLTYTAGLRSGQTININSPKRGVDEDFIIQAVSFEQISKDEYAWRVELATTKTLSMVDALQKLLLQERISLGEDETLLSFFDFADSFLMTDALTTPFTTSTTENYVWDDTEALSNRMIWDKFTWAA
jgi:hypothetical protein